jgi:hypothetical protein
MPKVLPSSSLDLAQRLNRIEQNLNILMSQSNITINGNTTGATNSNTMQGVTMGLIPAANGTAPIYGLATKGLTYQPTYDASTQTVNLGDPLPTPYQMQTGTQVAFSPQGNGVDGGTNATNTGTFFFIWDETTNSFSSSILSVSVVPGPSGEVLIEFNANIWLTVDANTNGWATINAGPDSTAAYPGDYWSSYGVVNTETAPSDKYWEGSLSGAGLFTGATPGVLTPFFLWWNTSDSVIAYFSNVMLKARPL